MRTALLLFLASLKMIVDLATGVAVAIKLMAETSSTFMRFMHKFEKYTRRGSWKRTNLIGVHRIQLARPTSVAPFKRRVDPATSVIVIAVFTVAISVAVAKISVITIRITIAMINTQSRGSVSLEKPSSSQHENPRSGRDYNKDDNTLLKLVSPAFIAEITPKHIEVAEEDLTLKRWRVQLEKENKDLKDGNKILG